MPVARKLVAVVFADVVGYSRLMERDEAGTHARLRELREKFLDPKIAEHGGRIVHTSGDGILLEFPSAGRNEALLAELDSDSRRAIALDDRDPRAWIARADALKVQWQWQASLEAYDRALALDPSLFGTRGGTYILAGRSAEALQAIAKRKAIAGVPDPSVLFNACHAHIHLGQYQEGIAECERAVVDGNDYWVYVDLTAAYAQTGDMARAAAAKAEVMKRAPDLTISRLLAKQFSNNPVWNEEIRTRFVPGWRKAGLPE
jgi:class 3 adenylate cyclase